MLQGVQHPCHARQVQNLVGKAMQCQTGQDSFHLFLGVQDALTQVCGLQPAPGIQTDHIGQIPLHGAADQPAILPLALKLILG